MSKLEFEKFLNENEAKEQKEVTINWEQQKGEWLNFIESFYQTIENWLFSFIKDERIKIEWSEKNITEEYIGSYSVRIMSLNFAGKKLTFDPIGTLLIGTKGRIDLNSNIKSVQFILADKESTGFKIKVSIKTENGDVLRQDEENPRAPDWTWKIVDRSSSMVKFIDFTEDNFFNILMELVNG